MVLWSSQMSRPRLGTRTRTSLFNPRRLIVTFLRLLCSSISKPLFQTGEAGPHRRRANYRPTMSQLCLGLGVLRMWHLDQHHSLPRVTCRSPTTLYRTRNTCCVYTKSNLPFVSPSSSSHPMLHRPSYVPRNLFCIEPSCWWPRIESACNRLKWRNS